MQTTLLLKEEGLASLHCVRKYRKAGPPLKNTFGSLFPTMATVLGNTREALKMKQCCLQKNLKMHMETDGLPEHRRWKGPKLASTGLRALGGSWPGLPQAGPPGHPCRAHRPSGQLRQNRGCAPLHPRPLTVMRQWELPHECPRSNQTTPRSPPRRDPWFFTPNPYSTAAWCPHGTARTCHPQRFVPQKGDRGHGTWDIYGQGAQLPRILVGSLGEGPLWLPGPAGPCSRTTRGLVFWGRSGRSPPGGRGVPRGGSPTETLEERRVRGSAAVAISEKNTARWEGPAGRDRGDRGTAPAALGGAGARVEGSGAQARSALGLAASSPIARPPTTREAAHGCTAQAQQR